MLKHDSLVLLLRFERVIYSKPLLLLSTITLLIKHENIYDFKLQQGRQHVNMKCNLSKKASLILSDV